MMDILKNKRNKKIFFSDEESNDDSEQINTYNISNNIQDNANPDLDINKNVEENFEENTDNNIEGSHILNKENIQYKSDDISVSSQIIKNDTDEININENNLHEKSKKKKKKLKRKLVEEDDDDDDNNNTDNEGFLNSNENIATKKLKKKNFIINNNVKEKNIHDNIGYRHSNNSHETDKVNEENKEENYEVKDNNRKKKKKKKGITHKEIDKNKNENREKYEYSKNDENCKNNDDDINNIYNEKDQNSDDKNDEDSLNDNPYDDYDANEDKENNRTFDETENNDFKGKRRKTKNSKLMEDINPDEDKKKLKSIQISFSKKEYNIEAYLMECLKVLIPLNMRDIFLGSENIILDNMNTGDIKNMEIFWFNKLTKNRQKSIIECYTSLNKQNKKKKKGIAEDNNITVLNSNSVSNMENNIMNLGYLNNEKDMNEENNENVENHMYNIINNNIMNKGEEDNSLNIPVEEEIFDNNKELIVVEHLVSVCNNQIKLIKEYISYIKKNIYDLSSINENNNRIKEMKILEPSKRREYFFYLYIAVSLKYVEEKIPNVYCVPTVISPDIRGFNLHPMFTHINKKLEEKTNKKDNIRNPWEKLKLLKKGNNKKNDVTNKNDLNKGKYKENSTMNKSEADENLFENNINMKDTQENMKNIDDTETSDKKELDDLEKKKKALEEMKRKKKEKDHKKTFNIYSLLESAAQFYGEGPKYCNPNIHEFYKSNNNQLVYIKPPTNVDEKNLLINFFLQFPSLNKKLEYNKKRIYAENYGLIKIIRNAENLPINFELNTEPWKNTDYEELWNEQNKLNNYQIWNMSNIINYDNLLEYNQFSTTKTDFLNHTDASRSVLRKNEFDDNDYQKSCAISEFEKSMARSEYERGEDKKEYSIDKHVHMNFIHMEEDTKEPKINNQIDATHAQKDMKPQENNNIDNDILLPKVEHKTEQIKINMDHIKDEQNDKSDQNNISHNASYGEVKKTEVKERKKNEILTKKLKKSITHDDVKQLKLTSFLSKEKINKNTNVTKKEEQSVNHVDNMKNAYNINSENNMNDNNLEEHIVNDKIKDESNLKDNEHNMDYIIKIKRNKKKVLDDEQMNNFTNDNANKEADIMESNSFAHNKEISERSNTFYNNNTKEGTKKNSLLKESENKEDDWDSEHLEEEKEKKKNKEKKRIMDDKMGYVFELEAEESEDENLEDPEERKKIEQFKKEQYEENEYDDDQSNSEDLKEFINNEEYNSDNDIVKLKHAEEMEKLEEDLFYKKFTYQGKQFNDELTNKEKLELEREKQLLRKKKLLLNCSIGNVKYSDFESDTSTDSDGSKGDFKNPLYEPYNESEHADMLKKNNNSYEYLYNDNVFQKGECLNEIVDEKKKKKILEKMDKVIYTKEVKTNEGKKIVIKKKRKIRFHQNLSDVTVTEEEKIDEYEKTKKKQKKQNANLIEHNKVEINKNNIMNHNNKASIKWNNNIKDISELDTPTNSEVFKGFRKVQEK
ncbi:conserved Plasmodium protein, unknown function [Plasmodium gaboni]|uniref:Uncharacterized protein n=1 Tax=Plasmodium gaboni TaxID=647221 RepID=A0ABY1USF5_9APIC|nr:conserved Plasmodium protein, unknown function [Plasmodium gaboni]